MSDSFFDPKSPKRTVSLTLNSDLYAKAKSLGINASKVAEEALVRAYADKRAELLAAEIREDLAATRDYEERFGGFADLVRAHHGRDEPV